METIWHPGVRRKIMALLLIVLPGAPAWACTTTKGGGDYASYTINIPIDKADAPYGEVLSNWQLMHTSPELHFVDGCDRNARVPFRGKLDNGSLRPVGSVVIGPYQYTTYELTHASPTAPLLVFHHYASTRTGGIGSAIQPIWDINDHYNPGFIPPAGGADGRGSSYYFAVVARGGPMTSLQAEAQFVSWPEAFPSLRIYSGFNLQVNIPPATCTLANQNVTLPAVAAAELSEVNGYARETPFTVGISCTLDSSGTVRLTLRDGIDSANTSTELTPTGTSTTQGVRLQLLFDIAGNHNPIAMGTQWGATITKGTRNMGFLARYYRIPGELRAGTIGSGATLTLTYF